MTGEPSKRIRKITVLFIESSEARDDCGSRMIFWIADDRYLSAVRAYHLTFRHGVDRVVSSFRVDIRFQRKQQFFYGGFIEDRYVSHRLKCRYDLCAFDCRQYWSTSAFLNSDLLIGVDPNDENVPELARACEITDVSDVKHIEASVR